MPIIKFGIIGAGWRCRFFMRIVKAYPDRFNCAGVVVRNAEKRQSFQQAWGVPTYASLDALLDAHPVDFIVVSTNENNKVILEVVERGVPCLSETPPARSEEELIRVFEAVQEQSGKVQIAEQYHLRPHHQAQTAVLKSGKIGEVSQAQTSIAHGFHGMSMIRYFLNIGYENAVIRGTTFTSPFIKGPDRAGAPTEEEIVDSEQVLAWFHFENNKLGTLDFTGNQYRAWVRNERLLIRGERGEISNNQIRYLKAFDEPMAFELERVTHGQEEDQKQPGFMGYRGEGEWLYRNPFARTILMDDEIAIAHCLEKMQRFVDTGNSFYSLAEASQDVYLSLLYEQACKEEKVVESETQIWAGR
ncbi:MAG: Gfo/Idh/MocA family oxidoreductase [Caldilineaceae bacterium]|nr:Gfo/Idh/MocA family oxidoreductase [Caldilineaceae bacterium]